MLILVERSFEAPFCRTFLADSRQQKRRLPAIENDVLYNAACSSSSAAAAATFLCLSLSKAAAAEVVVVVALHLSNFRLQTPSFLLV